MKEGEGEGRGDISSKLLPPLSPLPLPLFPPLRLALSLPLSTALLDTALRLPPAIRGALMPDAHYGYALPVGGVVAYDRAVAPFMSRSATGRPSALVYGKKNHQHVWAGGFGNLRRLTNVPPQGRSDFFKAKLFQDFRWRKKDLRVDIWYIAVPDLNEFSVPGEPGPVAKVFDNNFLTLADLLR